MKHEIIIKRIAFLTLIITILGVIGTWLGVLDFKGCLNKNHTSHSEEDSVDIAIKKNISFYFDYNNIPEELVKSLLMYQKKGISVRSISISSYSEWIILFNKNGFHHSTDFPLELSAVLDKYHDKGSFIKQVVFLPDNRWVVLIDKYYFHTSYTFHKDLYNVLKECYNEKREIKHVSFSNDYVWCVLIGKNSFHHSEYAPSGLNEKLHEYYKHDLTLKQVVLHSDDEWIIITDKGYIYSSSLEYSISDKFDENSKLNKYAYFVEFSKNGWIILNYKYK